jgi:hypothetical protein
MKPAVAFGVLHKAVAVFVKLPAVGKVFIRTLRKVVLIDKVVAGIIRRVDVNHLYLA